MTKGRWAAAGRTLAVALAVLLSLAGVGRGFVTASAGVPVTIGGFVLVLCHVSPGNAPASDPLAHACCDDCALCAAVVAPAPAALSEPAEVALSSPLDPRASSEAPNPRVWTPRQSQGPPVRPA